MALLDSELARIKGHLGFHLLRVGATPYIGVAAIFEQVIQPYLNGGAATTCATTVTAATASTPVTLTLASATGFTAGDPVIIDVDSRQERATVQAVSGSTITVLLSLAHTGTYPVTVEGGESIVRSILKQCDAAWTAYSEVLTSAGLESLGNGEIVWAVEGRNSRPTMLKRTLDHWRGELASALGIARMNGGGGGTMTTLY